MQNLMYMYICITPSLQVLHRGCSCVTIHLSPVHTVGGVEVPLPLVQGSILVELIVHSALSHKKHRHVLPIVPIVSIYEGNSCALQYSHVSLLQSSPSERHHSCHGLPQKGE